MIDKKERYKQFIIALLGILIIILFTVKIVNLITEPKFIPNREDLLNETKLLTECQARYMEDYHRTQFYQCKNQIGIEERVDDDGNVSYVPIYRTYIAYEACVKGCHPVYYPGVWNCTFYRDQPDFETIGGINVTHDGFSDWTYYPTRWTFDNMDLFEQVYSQYNQPVVCGYWVDEPYAAARNISNTVCEDIGERQYINRSKPYDKNNYYCCFRPEGFQGNYCYQVANVTEVMECECSRAYNYD